MKINADFSLYPSVDFGPHTDLEFRTLMRALERYCDNEEDLDVDIRPAFCFDDGDWLHVKRDRTVKYRVTVRPAAEDKHDPHGCYDDFFDAEGWKDILYEYVTGER